MAGCVNHPGVEAVARCKVCMKPVCQSCLVTGTTGNFCGEACRDKHEAFVKRAQELDVKRSKTTGLFGRTVRLVFKAGLFVVAVLVLAAIAQYFGFRIPVVSDFIGRYLPAR